MKPSFSHEPRPSSVLRTGLLTLFWFAAGATLLYPFLSPVEPEKKETRHVPRQPGIPDFSEFANIVEKKKAFFAYLMPEVRRQNERVMQERLFVLGMAQKIKQQKALTLSNQSKLRSLAKKYKVKSDGLDLKLVNTLIKRADIIPPELILVQAANESAWGTSRFARQGYNFFGLWCFEPGCGFVPSRRDGDASHEVARFPSLAHAMMTYIRNLNRHYAYEDLRSIRQSLRQNQREITAEALIQGLMSYSERGQDYIEELLNMIRHNRKYMQV